MIDRMCSSILRVFTHVNPTFSLSSENVEDTKGVIRFVIRRTDNTVAKMTNND
jgi:hypothetical protein